MLVPVLVGGVPQAGIAHGQGRLLSHPHVDLVRLEYGQQHGEQPQLAAAAAPLLPAGVGEGQRATPTQLSQGQAAAA